MQIFQMPILDYCVMAKQCDADVLYIFLRKKSSKKVRDLFSYGIASDEKTQ